MRADHALTTVNTRIFATCVHRDPSNRLGSDFIRFLCVREVTVEIKLVIHLLPANLIKSERPVQSKTLQACLFFIGDDSR